MFLSTEDISQRIFNSSSSILFIDTCIFLDILRSPYRDKISVNAISSALNLIKMSVASPRKVWLLTNEMVHIEWTNNIANVKQELEREIKKLERVQKDFVIATNVILKIEHTYNQEITSLNLHNHLENLSLNLLNHCLILKREDSHSVNAMHRVEKNIPPSKKGEQSKDCLIFEAFLDISKKLRNLGYSRKIYFVTSNSNDYGKANNPLIIDDLNKINATLIDNLSWALAEAKACDSF
ncbi:MAG: PIN domain-containing protein [Methylococcales bacterium]|nr:PIN domain-containing protein [Methylococcales bacterium]